MGIRRNSSAIPPGTAADYFGGTVPKGWLLCYGQAISRAQYARLFDAISTTHGAGDGSTTFNIPDSRGRTTFGKDNMGGTAANRLTAGGSGINGATLGAVGGAQTVTLTATEMPSHTHSQNAHSHVQSTSSGVTGAGTQAANTSAGIVASGISTQGTTATNNNNGSSGAHSNLPPALIANKIIKF